MSELPELTDSQQAWVRAMSDYPEHDKVKALKPKADIIAAFLEWLERDDIRIGQYHEHGEGCEHAPGEPSACGMIGRSHTGRYYLPALYEWRPPGQGERIERILALYFGVDLDAMRAEKERMFQELRKAATKEATDAT